MPSKKSKLHLYADQNIAVQTVLHLKSKGISIKHAYDFNYANKNDEHQFKKSKFLDRVLLSLDKDFRKFKGFPIKNHPGVILITSGNSTFEHINKILDKSLKYIFQEYVKHSILRITMDKIVKEKGDEKGEKNLS